MNTRKIKSNNHILTPLPAYPTNNLVMDMVKKAEQELELELQDKRHSFVTSELFHSNQSNNFELMNSSNRLKYKIDNETHEYHREILDKSAFNREYEFQLRRENLEKMKIDRELDRQKYVEMKQLQQHLQNSEELRIETSKRLLEECVQARQKQIEEKLKHESMLHELEQSILEEAKRKRQEENAKIEQEAEQVRMQKALEIRQAMAEEAARKREKKQHDKELERMLMQQTDEALKIIEEETKKAKQRDIQSQQEFIKMQIEQRKRDAELKRQQKIEEENRMVELAKKELERAEAEKAEAKKAQHVESLRFIDYMNRMRSDTKEIEADKFDLKQTSLINEDIDTEAEAKRIEERRQLREEKRREYFKQLNERHNAKIRQKQEGEQVFLETQKLNAEYEEMMAQIRAENRAQIVHDLDTQVKLKDMEMARKMEEESKCIEELKKVEEASKQLTQKILESEMQGLIKEHPFYRCLKSKNANA